MKKQLQSQSGAALLLVLFVVLFLSITGTVLLNATTYSTRSIVENKIEEKEFYILEGALDLVLYNLKKTEDYYGGTESLVYNGNPVYAPDGETPLKINKIGTYFFVQDYPDNIKPGYQDILNNVNIDRHEIKFNLVKVSNDKYKLSATLVENSTISRELYLKFNTEKPHNGLINRDDYIQSTLELEDNNGIHHLRKKRLEGKYIGSIDFEAKKKEYGLTIPQKLDDLTSGTKIDSSPAYYNNITASNKGTIIIPKGKVVYANSLSWTGQNRNLVVKGTLIINNFHIQSSGSLTIFDTGTIIANSFGIGSNSPDLVFENETGSTFTPPFITDIDWVSNISSIDDYQTAPVVNSKSG